MDLTAFYDVDSFKELPDWVGIEAGELPHTNDRKELAAFIAKKVVIAYKKRGQDMSRFSAQLKSDLCLKKTSEGRWEFGSYQDVDGNDVSFRSVVIAHQDYFKEVLSGKKKFKFRDAAHAGNKSLEKAAMKEVASIFAAEIFNNKNLEGSLKSLRQFSSNKITTPDMAPQALMQCNTAARKQVLDGVATNATNRLRLA